MADKKPSRYAYTVIELGKGKKDFWQRIGSAWLNKDGSITVKLNALPLNGTLVLQLANDDADDAK